MTQDHRTDTATPTPAAATPAGDHLHRTEPRQILELAEEQVTIRRREVDLGGVRLRTVTESFDQTLQVELQRHDVEVRRVPIGKVVDRAPGIRVDGGTTIIPIIEERPVVTTELVLVEEVHLIRTEAGETIEIPVTLRRQTLVEEALAPEGSGGSATNPSDR